MIKRGRELRIWMEVAACCWLIASGACCEVLQPPKTSADHVL